MHPPYREDAAVDAVRMVGGRDGDELGVHLGQGPRLRMVRIAHGDQMVPARVGEQPLDGLRRRVHVL
jgi:hypothetical protein